MSLAVVALVFLVGWQLARGSMLSIRQFGFHFLITSTWDPVAEQFGALPFIYGTIVSSLIALIIAVAMRGAGFSARSFSVPAARSARRWPSQW
jgi:phosphate transport system permease protein